MAFADTGDNSWCSGRAHWTNLPFFCSTEPREASAQLGCARAATASVPRELLAATVGRATELAAGQAADRCRGRGARARGCVRHSGHRHVLRARTTPPQSRAGGCFVFFPSALVRLCLPMCRVQRLVAWEDVVSPSVWAWRSIVPGHGVSGAANFPCQGAGVVLQPHGKKVAAEAAVEKKSAVVEVRHRRFARPRRMESRILPVRRAAAQPTLLCGARVAGTPMSVHSALAAQHRASRQVLRQ